MSTLDWRFPAFNHRAFAIWWRNFLVWIKLIGSAIALNFGEPLLYLLGLGYGLGVFIDDVQGMDYLTFLASGIIASTTMTVVSFEGMYSVFTRMSIQRTYEGMLATPIEIDDIVLGEMLWCASKGTFAASAIFVVAYFLGTVKGEWALLAIPLCFLIGFAFAGIAMIMSSMASSYDFFNYYFSLVLTPMLLLSGVFYPVSNLPEFLQWLVYILPLSHAIELVRPLIAAYPSENVLLHLSVLVFYSIMGYYIALVLTRRRLLV